MWYLIVSIPDLCRLSYFVLASHRYYSTHCVDVVDIWEKKKAELQKLPLPRAVFLEGVKRAQYQCIIWKTSSVINPDKSMPDNYGKKRDCDKYCPIMMTLPMCGSRGG